METSTSSIRSLILRLIGDIAEQQNKRLRPLVDELPLMESGLDSLCLAVLVAALDDEIGFDPFSQEVEAVFPVTIGDFIRLYEHGGH